MKFERTGEEILKDKALTLAFWARIQETNSVIGDRLKMQKLVFFLCYKLFTNRYKGLNYTFFTYRWGPFTKDLYEVEADFEQAELLERKGQLFNLTETGLAFGRDLFEALQDSEENYPILEIMESVIEEYASWTTERLVTHTHKMSVRPLGWSEPEILEELPYHLDLTRILDDEEARAILEIERSWLDSLGYVLDKSSMKASVLNRY